MNTLTGVKRWGAEELRLRRSTPKQEFQYTRLSTEPGSAFIRLLDLVDNDSGDIIRCRLNHVDLKARPTPKYEAVSYSWRRDVLRERHLLSAFFPAHFSEFRTEEQGAATRIILCNNMNLRIQHNLYDFLVRLRQKRRSLPLWIDAICIDQNEEDKDVQDEKYRQLEMMGQIYESAEAVLVWLGESSNVPSSLPRVLESLQSLELKYEPFRTEYDVLKLLDDSFPLKIWAEVVGVNSFSWLAFLSSYKRTWSLNGFVRLLNRDYFRRAWVVQEMALARKLHFFVGSMEIPGEHLLHGIQIISILHQIPGFYMNFNTQRAGFLAMPHMLRSRDDRQMGTPWSFDDYLFLCRDRQASRPEDKVFAILGLVSEHMRKKLIDGVKSKDGILLDKLYVNCGRLLANEVGWPYLLSLVGMGAADGQDLPSWVPDLRVPLWPKPYWFFGCTHFKAATSIPHIFTVSENPPDDGFRWSLTLSAKRIDKIVQVGESHNELHLSQIKHAEGHVLDLVAKLGRWYHKTEELSMDAFMKTLTADIFKRSEQVSLIDLRRSFINWLEFTFGMAEYPESMIDKWLLKMSARTHNISSVRDCSDISGTHINMSEAIDSFLQMHDSSTFPIAEKLNRTPRQPRPENDSETAIPQEQAVGEVRVAGQNGNPDDDEFAWDDFYKWIQKDVRIFATAIDHIYQDRRIFRTGEQNLVGIGPRDIRRGDVVYLVAGAPTPFVFRRMSTGMKAQGGTDCGRPGRVRLVGSAYLHGAMYGELAGDSSTVFEELSVV